MAQDVCAYFEISGSHDKGSFINVLDEKNYESTALNEQERILVEAVYDWKMMKTNEERASLFIKHLKKGNSSTK